MHGAAPKRKRLTPKPRHPPREETTLVCLIKSLVDSKVVVELRNDILLRGRLDDVDDFLNMSLSNVTFQTVEGHKATYQSMYLKGRNLRFVHLPKTLDPAAAVDSYRRKVVASKLAALQERARALGEGKREGKGQDADMGMVRGGGEGGGGGDERGGGAMGPAEGDEGEAMGVDGDEEEVDGDDGGDNEAGGSSGGSDSDDNGGGGGGGGEKGGGRGGGGCGVPSRQSAAPPPVPGLQHLDPRAVAAAGMGTDAEGGGGDEEEGLW